MGKATTATRWKAFRADRLSALPPYLFVEIDRKKREAVRAGRDVIDFGVGDPDRPTPGFVVDRMAEAIREPTHHRYAPSRGLPELRRAIAQFFERRYGVALDPDREVLVLIGAKEGIGHLPLAVVNPGDVVLVPEPGYPVYTSGAVFAGGECVTLPLRSDRDWLPDLASIPPSVCEKARLLWLNYPNNPTAAVAPTSFFREAVAFAKKNRVLIAQDAAYNEIYYGDPPPSILQIRGAKQVAIEFHSLSKTFNMTGWRVAFAVGQPKMLEALATVKNNLDSGVFAAVQHAGMTALKGIRRPEIGNQLQAYRRRRDAIVDGLRRIKGWSVAAPEATIYVWARCPQRYDSMAVASRLLDEADVVVIPGAGFGPAGEGFVRLALTVPEDRTREAMERIARLAW